MAAPPLPCPPAFPPSRKSGSVVAAGPILPDSQGTHTSPFLVGLLSPPPPPSFLPVPRPTRRSLSSANMVDECLKSWPVPLSLKRARPLPALRPTATGLREVEGGREREREACQRSRQSLSLSARPSLWVNQRGRSVGRSGQSGRVHASLLLSRGPGNTRGAAPVRPCLCPKLGHQAHSLIQIVHMRSHSVKATVPKRPSTTMNEYDFSGDCLTTEPSYQSGISRMKNVHGSSP